MNRSKKQKSNQVKFFARFGLFLLIVVLILINFLVEDLVSSARTRPSTAIVRSFMGTMMVTGTRPNNSSLNAGQILTVSKNSWAHLELKDSSGRIINPLIQAGIDTRSTKYKLFCQQMSGTTVVAWGLRDTNSVECERIVVRQLGVPVRLRNIPQSKLTKSLAQRPQDISNAGETIIARGKKSTLIQIHSFDGRGRLEIDVLGGAVTIEPPASSPVTVGAGNRYIDPGDGSRIKIEPINVATIAQSTSVKTFLNSNAWSQDITPLIRELRSTLNRPSPPPTQTPIPRRIVGSACTCKSDSPDLAGIELQGKWEISKRPDVPYECVGKWQSLGLDGRGVRVPEGPRCS